MLIFSFANSFTLPYSGVFSTTALRLALTCLPTLLSSHLRFGLALTWYVSLTVDALPLKTVSLFFNDLHCITPFSWIFCTNMHSLIDPKLLIFQIVDSCGVNVKMDDRSLIRLSGTLKNDERKKWCLVSLRQIFDSFSHLFSELALSESERERNSSCLASPS